MLYLKVVLQKQICLVRRKEASKKRILFEKMFKETQRNPSMKVNTLKFSKFCLEWFHSFITFHYVIMEL